MFLEEEEEEPFLNPYTKEKEDAIKLDALGSPRCMHCLCADGELTLRSICRRGHNQLCCMRKFEVIRNQNGSII